VVRPDASPVAAIAIGASAGGVTALQTVIDMLPASLDAAVLVVLHLDPRRQSLLADLLRRHAALRVQQAADGDALAAGTAYVAPPDAHMVVDDAHIRLTHTVPVHHTRPSIDLLFESVARKFDGRAVAVVLTGSGADGANGIRAVKRLGGTTLAQDPLTAEHPSMPRAACATGCVDHVLPLERIGPALAALAAGLAVPGPA
jgi:two-component system chemotaxis response regulator CheB